MKKEKDLNLLNKELDAIFKRDKYLGLHSEHERLLGCLYSCFSKKFPDDEIWPFLTEEERKHEMWIKQIFKKVNEGVILYEDPVYSLEVLKSSIINLAELIEYSKSNEVTLKEACRIAYDNENSIIENRFFEYFSSDAPAVDGMLKKLVTDTMIHKEWLQKKIDTFIE